MSEIDWNLELRKIERQYDGLPPEPSASVVKARKAREQRQREQVEARVAQFGAVARLVLVATLVTALYWWPYATRCGLDLAALLVAQSMVIVGGLWAAAYAWRHRLAACHAVALLLLLAGLVLVSAQLLPRAGWVTIVGIEATEWRCVATSAVASARSGAPTSVDF